MNKNIRWKLLTSIGVFVIFAAVGIYPIIASHFGINSPSWLMDKQLKLGLDLKGGVHLVLRVQTDDALRLETETTMERVREAMGTANIKATNFMVVSPVQFRIKGVPSEASQNFRQAAADADTNFDRTPGINGTSTFTMKPNVQRDLRAEAVVQARETIER